MPTSAIYGSDSSSNWYIGTCGSYNVFLCSSTSSTTGYNNAPDIQCVTQRVVGETREEYESRVRQRREEEEQRAIRWVREEEERKRKRQEAEDVAKTLLESMLTPEQLASFRETECFDVISQTGKRFRVEKRWSGNMIELDEEGRSVARYCAHPSSRFPIYDAMLTQKLMLEADEERILGVANRTRMRRLDPLPIQ